MAQASELILNAGTAGPDGRRGMVVRYPGSADYFRRALTRVSDASSGTEDAAARLLAMTRLLLDPRKDAGVAPPSPAIAR